MGKLSTSQILPRQFCSAPHTRPVPVSGGFRYSARLMPTHQGAIPLAGGEACSPADAGQPRRGLLTTPSTTALPLLRSELANHPADLPAGSPPAQLNPNPVTKTIRELRSPVLRPRGRQLQFCKVCLKLRALLQRGINSGKPLKIPLGFRIS